MREVPQVDFPLDRYELLVLRVGEKAGEMQPDERRRLQAEHVAYLFGLQRSGKLLAAGAVASSSITGLGFFTLGSIEEVRALAAKDPSVTAGLDAAEVYTFMCPKGSLAFPKVV